MNLRLRPKQRSKLKPEGGRERRSRDFEQSQRLPKDARRVDVSAVSSASRRNRAMQGPLDPGAVWRSAGALRKRVVRSSSRPASGWLHRLVRPFAESCSVIHAHP